MATNSIILPGAAPAATPNTRQAEPSIEIRINSIDDAIAAVQNSKLIHDEAVARGMTSIEFLVARGIEKQCDKILIGVFRLKLYFKTITPQPGNLFMSLPHVKKFEVPIRLHPQNLRKAAIEAAGEVEDIQGLVPPGLKPEKIDRRKFNRPPPRKMKAPESQT